MLVQRTWLKITEISYLHYGHDKKNKKNEADQLFDEIIVKDSSYKQTIEDLRQYN